jgi:dsDNA-binding SOS-regulon protein
MGTTTADRPRFTKGGKRERIVAAEAKVESPGKQTPAPVPAGKVEYTRIPPNAAKTLTAIREMGYDSFASIMDLVDNSVDAKASKIAVQIKGVDKGNQVTLIDVLDNGVGMDQAILAQALRLGSDTEHNVTDLGKYGFGLVSASLSMAKRIDILTRKNKGQAFEAVFDLDTIQRVNDFVIELRPATSHAKVVETLGDQGTLVRLTSIDRISDNNVARFAANLRAVLAATYREFIKSGLKLSVNGKIVKADDPLMRDHPQTEKLLEEEIKFGDKAAWLTVVELPDLGQIGNEEAGILPHRSGFYVVRNGRQIMAAQTFGFYRHHHSYSGFRAELSFSGDLDDLFHVDIKKATIHPDDKLLGKLREETEKLIQQSGRRQRERPVETVKLKLGAAEDVLNQALQKQATPAPHIVDGHGTKFIDEAQGQPATAANGGAVPVEGVDVQSPKGQEGPGPRACPRPGGRAAPAAGAVRGLAGRARPAASSSPSRRAGSG